MTHFRLMPMRDLKRLHCADLINARHAFVENLHRGHYDDVLTWPTIRESVPVRGNIKHPRTRGDCRETGGNLVSQTLTRIRE
jgi:hypothetical protein